MLFSRTIRFAPSALLVLALFVGTGHRAPSSASAAGDCTVDATMDSEEQAFLVLINNYRAQNSLGPLSASYMLTRASAWKSKDLATNNYFAHDDLTRTWSARIVDCDYGFNTWLGENIAAGYTTAASVFAGWQASPGHNANMLGTNYTTIGIGRYFVQGSTYGWYWTTDFGGFSDGWATRKRHRVADRDRWRVANVRCVAYHASGTTAPARAKRDCDTAVANIALAYVRDEHRRRAAASAKPLAALAGCELEYRVPWRASLAAPAVGLG